MIPLHHVGRWMSKLARLGTLTGKVYGKAHFIIDGEPACAFARLRDGRPALAPFVCGWTDLKPLDSHLCSICRREAKRMTGTKPECFCGKCRIKPFTDAFRKMRKAVPT